jgi:hypothetical protein
MDNQAPKQERLMKSGISLDRGRHTAIRLATFKGFKGAMVKDSL